MRDEIARGRRASDAARVVRATLEQSGTARALVESLLGASTRMDPAAIGGVLDRADQELDLAETFDDVLMPAMRQIGEWWRTGQCDIGQEHLTTEAVRGWLSRRMGYAPDPVRSDLLLLACGPRDTHTLGLEAFAVLLAYRGWPVRHLGARTPSSTITTAARATGAAGVIVVSHMSLGRRPAIDAIHEAAASGRTVFYAGNAFLSGRGRTGIPGTYLGERLSLAVKTVEARLGERAQPGSAGSQAEEAVQPGVSGGGG